MSYLEHIEHAPATEKVIILKSTFGKQQGATTFQPVKTRGGSLLGVKEYTDEEKRTVQKSLIITEETELRVEDGMELDLSTEYGRVTWAWLQHQPDIAMSQEQAQQMPDAVFYVKDEEKELLTSINKTRDVANALDIVLKQASGTKRLEICRLLGERMDNQAPLAVEEYLSSIAMRTPERIINAYQDKDYKAKVFLYALLDKGLVRIVSEVYKYGSYTMGITEDQVLLWLRDRNNAPIVEHMKANLYPGMHGINQVSDETFDAPVYNEEPRDITPLTPAFAVDDISNPSDFGTGAPEQLTPATPARKGARN